MGRRENKCIGIVREVYNKWERRAPLCPSHVKELTAKGFQVLVQPSTTRIFSNEQYSEAGATITDDLSPSSIIVGVKQVPVNELLDKKTYLFFSHTIKGQRENMELLDAILRQRIRLIDYECITENGERNGKRKIAFGEYAGRAGMVNTFRGLGERLLARGYSTPFLNIGSCYMYGGLEHAKEALERAGREISTNGLPQDIAPMTFVFTGKGNVSNGAQELFQLMPHQMVEPSELPNLPVDRNRLYGCVVTEKDMVESKNGGDKVDRSHYFRHPEGYRPIFHEKIAPYASAIVNCMYWDNRYPRLLTKKQMEEFYNKGHKKLIGIGDITCDVGGSIEFLTKTTDIEQPFYLYDVQAQATRDSLDGDGVMMMGVDILPSELPRESSSYFGDNLVPYLESLFQAEEDKPLSQQSHVSEELRGGCIAEHGALLPNYEYIGKLRAERDRKVSLVRAKEMEKNAGSTCVHFQGQLFDTGLINQALNVIEAEGGRFYIVDCQVRPNLQDASTSSATVQITADSISELQVILKRLHTLCEVTPGADATLTELPEFCNDYSMTAGAPEESVPAATESKVVNIPTRRKVLCLGAGLVVSPLLEYLSRDPGTEIVVVSAVSGEAQGLADKLSRPNIFGQTLDAVKDAAKIDQLCGTVDCVVSLLPATMHVGVAESCIKHGVPLVTASYISPEMKALNEAAKEKGIPILCEMGLDPGMDHMSAMKIIDQVKSQQRRIVSFSSVCGGLPAPEAADNPLGYKFSWSPRGVLLAAQNAARYRKDGKVIQVSGDEMLSTAERVNFLPAFALEQLPNRDSLPYADIYGIPEAHSIFRGTLRYAGWSQIMYECKKLGLLDSIEKKLPGTWDKVMQQLDTSVNLSSATAHCLNWLGLNSTEAVAARGSTMDSFCELLERKLSYKPGERDMALMHHEFTVESQNKELKTMTSTFVGYGEPNGDTIMAKTVGVTAAIGVELILEKAIEQTGVLAPTTPDIYNPGLAKLEAEGIIFVEKSG